MMTEQEQAQVAQAGGASRKQGQVEQGRGASREQPWSAQAGSAQLGNTQSFRGRLPYPQKAEAQDYSPETWERALQEFGPAALAAWAARHFWESPAQFYRAYGSSARKIGLRTSLAAQTPQTSQAARGQDSQFQAASGQASRPQALAVSQLQTPQTPRKPVKTVGVYYFRYGGGGAERVAAYLARLWDSLGYRVVLFADEPASPQDFPLPENVERVLLPSMFEANAQNYEARAQALVGGLQSHQVDVLVYHQWLAWPLPWDMLACHLCGVPFVVHTHGVFGCMYRWNDRVEIQLPIVYSYADGVVALSAVDAAFWRMHNAHVWQTANPLTLKPQAQVRSSYHKPEIVWVGRLDHEQKRPVEALEIMQLVAREIPEAHLSVVGPANSPHEMEALVQQVQDRGLQQQVSFEGPKQDVTPYLRQASVFLSTASLEGWPLALAEAKAYALPTVMYELPYLTLAEQGSGVIAVPQGDRVAAARALVALLRNQARCKQLGKQALDQVKAFQNFDYAALWDDIFATVASPAVAGPQYPQAPAPAAAGSQPAAASEQPAIAALQPTETTPALCAANARIAQLVWDVMAEANTYAIDIQKHQREELEHRLGVAEAQAAAAHDAQRAAQDAKQPTKRTFATVSQAIKEAFGK